MWATVIPLIFAQFTAGLQPKDQAPRQNDLVAVAATSPRPAECTPDPQAIPGSLHLWQTVAHPSRFAYCAALARGYAVLAESPATALRAAIQASELNPRAVPPLVLRARALWGLGKPEEAWRFFRQAHGASSSALRAPAALHDFALAARWAQDNDQALQAYRSLVARAELLQNSLERQRVYVEAAAAAMWQGPQGLTEARGYLAEAVQQELLGLHALVLGALALALDRDGQEIPARGVLSEAGGPWSLLRLLPEPPSEDPADPPFPVAKPALPVLPPGELDAIVAILAEQEAPALAAEHWQRFVDVASAQHHPWLAHGQRKLQQLAGR